MRIYKVIDKAVVRTPLFPLEWLNAIEKIINSHYFQEGLYLASPLIYQLCKKKELSQKVKFTIHKYAHRSAFRCTPFGLYAGNSVAQIGINHKVNLSTISSNIQYISLNIECIRRLIELLNRNTYIRNRIIYFPNNSIYSIANKYHYIEYHFINGKDVYNHSTIDRSEIIDFILRYAINGISIQNAVNLILSEDSNIQYSDAWNFICDMIDSQLLKSELEIDILEEQPLNNLIAKLQKIGETEISLQLSIIADILKKNQKICSQSYQLISNQIGAIFHKIGIPCEQNNIINVDLYKPTKIATISHNSAFELEKLLALLVKIQPPITNERIKEFAVAFERKYEDREIELAIALDNEYGLGYPINRNDVDDQSELLSDLITPRLPINKRYTIYNQVENILLKKLFKCIQNNESVISIEDSDFDGINYKGNFPPTIYVLCSILKNDKIFIKAIGGVSAANIISRFVPGNNDIQDIVKEISNIEQNYTTDILLAEVAHIPDRNDGNIVCRIKHRNYTIPYISNYRNSEKNIIPISDIVISVRDGEVILRSKRLNKRIVPRYTSAYNYDRSQLPIIRFLSDMQCANMTDVLSCKWNDMLYDLDYLPRIQYNNCVLARQRWLLYRKEIELFLKCPNDEWFIRINQYIDSRGIPSKIIIVEFDNELYIDIADFQDSLLLKSIITKKYCITIEEFIYSQGESIAELNNEHYANEVVMFFKQNGNK